MSSLPGIITNVVNNIVAPAGAPGNTIVIIGHVDGLSAEAYWTPDQKGFIYQYQSLSDFQSAFGNIDISTNPFVNGAKATASTAAVPPYDKRNSVMRMLDILYFVNLTADVAVFPIDPDYGGAGANELTDDLTIVPQGMAEALEESLFYFNVFGIILAGLEPVLIGKQHAELASDSSGLYNSPRFYFTGVDLFSVWDDFTTPGRTPPLTADDLSEWNSVKSDLGLVENYVGNHLYNFRVVNGTESALEIGGQLAVAMIAGLATLNSPAFSFTRETNPLGALVYGGQNLILRPAELLIAQDDGWLTNRFIQNTHVINKGITYATSKGQAYNLYPVRAVANYMHKALVIALTPFLGQMQTSTVFISAKAQVDQVLQNARDANLILSSYSSKVSADPNQVDAIIAEVSFEVIKPINTVKLNITVS